MDLLVLIVSVIPFFFFKLGQSSLISWDEAWYGEIAKQMLISGNHFVMKFNGVVFTDHPPVGFWLIGISERIFGMHAFAVRLSSAILGILTLVGVYFLGRKLYSRLVGWCVALSMVSAPWFLYRSRTGDLDVLLTCLLVWCVYLALKATESKRFFIVLIVALNLLFLTKTMIPFTILPVIVFIFLGNKKYKLWELILGLCASFVGFLVWVNLNTVASNIFWQRYLSIGAPGVAASHPFLENLKGVKAFLYSVVGRWFWPSILALGLSSLSFKKKLWIPMIMFVSFMGPFLLSDRGQIWHMIPAAPFMFLALFGITEEVVSKITRNTVIKILMLCGLLVIFGLPQLNKYWREFVNIDAFVSDEEILSTEAGKYKGTLYVDYNFFPAAAFYSNKPVYKILGPMEEVFDRDPKPYTVITNDWRLNTVDRQKYPYEIIKKDRDKVLIYRE